MKWYTNIPKVISHFFTEEFDRGTLKTSVISSFKKRNLNMVSHESFSGLLEKQARIYPYKDFIYFKNEIISFKDANQRSNSMAHFLNHLGLKDQDGLGIMMPNCPEFLYAFYATQKLSMYSVPINTALIGDGLKHIIEDSEIKALVIDQKHLHAFHAIQEKLKRTIILIVKDSIDDSHTSLDNYIEFSTEKNNIWKFNPSNKSSILYTSGTTGLPKGVVLKYNAQIIRRLGLINNLIYNKNDILFTCLPLFHVNALYLSFSASLWLGIPIVLEKKFSAGRFWEQINKRKATVVNTIGAMIPILLKTHSEAKNSIRLVLSAACPAESWKEFEKRFKVAIWECYSAVDGGQNYIFNMGNAPVGSVGRISKSKFKIINDLGEDCDPTVPGELCFKISSNKQPLEYYKNEQASKSKIKNGYLHTGDLVYKDKKGFLYFVGRKTESIRRKGENISAYEVEQAIQSHPKVLECAVYGVPSDLAEEEIMTSIVMLSNQSLSPEELKDWLTNKIANFAHPRYIRYIKKLPKTLTQKKIKYTLKQEGITKDTFDMDNINGRKN